MLRIRVLTALIGLPLIIGLVFAGGWWFFAGIAVVALLSGWEFNRMMRVGGYAPNLVLSLALVALLLLDSRLSFNRLDLVISLALLAGLIWQLFRPNTDTPVADWALTMGGAFYVGWGMSRLVTLRQLPDGLAWVWLAFLITWGADTMAYLVGSAWGRHKIWPRLSPKKSWEGFLGSIAGGLVGAGLVLLFSGLPLVPALLLGALAPIVAFFGDMTESMIKRNTGVKDSSDLLPGHGGFLDRIDSLLFVSIVVYYSALWLG